MRGQTEKKREYAKPVINPDRSSTSPILGRTAVTCVESRLETYLTKRVRLRCDKAMQGTSNGLLYLRKRYAVCNVKNCEPQQRAKSRRLDRVGDKLETEITQNDNASKTYHFLLYFLWLSFRVNVTGLHIPLQYKRLKAGPSAKGGTGISSTSFQRSQPDPSARHCRAAIAA